MAKPIAHPEEPAYIYLMTTTRINHTGHAHANTTAARTACRKMLATAAPVVAIVAPAPVARITAPIKTDTRIFELHCSSCGSTDHEDMYTGDQGYTACCNKRTEHPINGVVCTGCSHN